MKKSFNRILISLLILASLNRIYGAEVKPYLAYRDSLGRVWLPGSKAPISLQSDSILTQWLTQSTIENPAKPVHGSAFVLGSLAFGLGTGFTTYLVLLTPPKPETPATFLDPQPLPTKP